MTKQESAENTLKCHLSVEEGSKIGLDVTRLVENSIAALGNQQVYVEQEPQIKLPRAVKTACPKKSRLGRVTQKLYNLEPDNRQEKPLNIELDLYQMETS